MLINKIARLIQIIGDPKAIKGLIKYKKTFSISSFRINTAIASYQPIFHTIFDVGANMGQFALSAAQRFPMAKIYCFEPVPDVYNSLKVNIKRFSNIHAYNYAIGNTNGKIPFYRNEFTLVSSALPIHDDNNQPNYDEKVSRIIQVDIFRMDDLISFFDIRKPVLLKLDVQGYEKMVLEGAIKILKHVNYLILEASFIQLYKKQPLFDELHEYLKNLGFEFVAPVDVNVGNDFAIIEMDVLYRKLR